MVASEGVSEKEFSLVSPAVGIAIASIGQGHIEIPTWAVTDIMYKLIRASFVVLKGVFAVFGVWKGEIAFSWLFELDSFVYKVFGE